jgi:hypothetical protein
MQIVINIPDEFIDPVKEKLATGPTGILESIALDAILGYLTTLSENSN